MSQSTQKFEEKCKRFFEAANDGKPVTIGQLTRIIRQACPTFKGDDSEIAQIFLEIDVNNDKLVTWEEFSSALNAKNPKEVTRAELELVFKELDKDGSGRLEKGEIRRLCQQEGLDISEDDLNDLMQEADPNGDGVSIDEFLAQWAAKN
ncbi:hypothetical protein Btru_044011 [Bulinus truncatus]|nr:hypothetical protein Btru_044011 [Bulinus truncatus]